MSASLWLSHPQSSRSGLRQPDTWPRPRLSPREQADRDGFILNFSYWETICWLVLLFKACQTVQKRLEQNEGSKAQVSLSPVLRWAGTCSLPAEDEGDPKGFRHGHRSCREHREESCQQDWNIPDMFNLWIHNGKSHAGARGLGAVEEARGGQGCVVLGALSRPGSSCGPCCECTCCGDVCFVTEWQTIRWKQSTFYLIDVILLSSVYFCKKTW